MTLLAKGKHEVKSWLARKGYRVERTTVERDFIRQLDCSELALKSLVARLSERQMDADLFEFIKCHSADSVARSFDDLFAWWALLEAQAPWFVEAGCWDPIYRNNTYLLESRLGWEGVLVEASPRWWAAIEASRDATLIRAALVPESGRDAPAYVELSGASSASIHTRQGRLYKGNPQLALIPTVTLREILDSCPRNASIFLSLDVEGNEAKILTDLDYYGHAIKAVSVEALTAVSRSGVTSLLEGHGFTCVLPEISHYNLWFVHDSMIRD